MDQTLLELVFKVWKGFESASGKHILRPSIPILFFGDLTAYLSSPIKVITVGLNPSSAEFPRESPMRRFKGANRLVVEGVRSNQDAREYVSTLSEYFRDDPYGPWFFTSFGSILTGLGADYTSGSSLALHTDICSPIATSPTWSGLTRCERGALDEWGSNVWRELVEYLQPDVALISVAKEHLEKIQFGAATDWSVVHRIERKRPYEVSASKRILDSGKTCLFVYGQAAQLPFGTVASSNKFDIGRSILGVARG